ncbi:hypothetical protein [Hymenobacter siberiensis]|uniref:hypothetical protein n=1 Tax=Hymenobacter siberiensis TaxID=2848396 RepID=UPI001C1E2857|nr:hypothetical protein [Hymenobacter siberiensis]MBU6122296.1 hypothetical protein [Hymenobacter siberiensis]
MPRICLYPKDVATLTGRSYDAAKRLVRRARQAAGKPAGALVTVQDFCRLTGLDAAEVSAAINSLASR